MNEETLFAAALDKHDAVERRAFLDEACAGDDGLRKRVERLLVADDRAPGILDHTRPAAPHVEAFRLESLAAGQTFARRFVLRQKLGEGGMGEVWAADQQEPVWRRVALKVIRPGLASARALSRFDQERQALALMSHPNIAKVLEAGVEEGRPYFVMELIEGAPVTRHCDEAKLTLRERLRLFLPVCEAVQHAHSKGVIHRDLKPSNILVESHDGKPLPKVIDFGLAKPTGPLPIGPNVSTEVGTLVGTPEYMSPEQADVNNLDIDTRSDVYALGVLLYELLTGGVPHSRQELQSFAFTEMLRVIKEVEPPIPSKRLASAPEALLVVAAKRQAEPNQLLALVRGELDWIVMKCLEKDPARRYETANELAADVRRHLADEPVLAGPPSRGYRLRKFLRRNRGPVLAASLVLLALVGGVVGTTVGLVRAGRARDTAEKRLEQIEKGIDALGAIFEDLDPRAEEKEGRPLRAILGDRLDRAAAALDEDAVGDPLVVARLQDRLGRTYLGLGHPAKAEALLAKAVASRRARLGSDDPLTLASLQNQALASRDAGKWAEAVARLEQVRAAREKTLVADHPDTLGTLNQLAWAYGLVGRKDEAVVLYEKVRDAREKTQGPDHPDRIDTLYFLGWAYLHVGRKAEAIALFEKVRVAREEKHGPDHPEAIAAVNALARAYQVAGRMRAALALLQQARTAVVAKLGEEHPTTLMILDNLAWMFRVLGRTAEAIELADQVRAKRVLHLGAYHPATLLSLDHLGMAYRDAGNLKQAFPLFQQAADGVERLQFAHANAIRIVQNLCDCHERMKQYDQAEVWRRKWLAVLEARGGPESPAYAEQLEQLGANLIQQKKFADAEAVLRPCLAIVEKIEPDDLVTFHAQTLLGAALLGQKKYADAETHLIRGVQGMKKWEERLGGAHHTELTREPLADALKRLVELYDARGQSEEAAKRRKELEALKAPATK